MVAGAACLPLLVLAVIAIGLVDPGPVLYAQSRRGLHGRAIRVWKLRTMYRDSAARLECHLAADPAARAEWSRCFKLRRDPRVLPGIGPLLRRSSIDELPQLWNVLRGEMALIGPRPLPDYHLAGCDARFLRLRQSVRPGITGLWQVSARDCADLATLRRLDGCYVRNWSLALDLRIMLCTIRAVATGKGAC
jgi:lipopolysaccharide/colanic/teichoic acid biosynthesis glycosyltransferase